MRSATAIKVNPAHGGSTSSPHGRFNNRRGPQHRALAVRAPWWQPPADAGRERKSQPRVFLYLLVTQLLELAAEVAPTAVVDGADRGCDQRLKETARTAATRAPGAVQGGLCLTALPAWAASIAGCSFPEKSLGACASSAMRMRGE